AEPGGKLLVSQLLPWRQGPVDDRIAKAGIDVVAKECSPRRLAEQRDRHAIYCTTRWSRRQEVMTRRPYFAADSVLSTTCWVRIGQRAVEGGMGGDRRHASTCN